MENVKILFTKVSDKAQVPYCAYNGTSAAFDIYCSHTTTIPPNSSAKIPNDLKVSIREKDPFYMMVHTRSSIGFNNEIICHPGIIDAGYTGILGIKLYNLGDKPFTIKEGERYAQITIHRKHNVEMVELNDSEFREYEKSQLRGNNGFGSSSK